MGIVRSEAAAGRSQRGRSEAAASQNGRSATRHLRDRGTEIRMLTRGSTEQATREFARDLRAHQAASAEMIFRRLRLDHDRPEVELRHDVAALAVQRVRESFEETTYEPI